MCDELRAFQSFVKNCCCKFYKSMTRGVVLFQIDTLPTLGDLHDEIEHFDTKSVR